MRCRACNRNLSNRESTRKSITTGEYLDLCDWCFDTIKDVVPSVEGNSFNDEGIEEPEPSDSN